MSAATAIAALPATPEDQMRTRADLPDALRETLLPHERIVWVQRGRGIRWPLVYTALPLLLIAFIALGVCLILQEASAAPGLGQLFLLIFVAIAGGAILLQQAATVFGPSRETYALTDLRVVHCSTFLLPLVRSLTMRSVTGENELLITRLAVWGRPDLGWIMLRSDHSGGGRRGHFGVTSLVGVERPLDVAALIKSTLKLDVEIEDHTRP